MHRVQEGLRELVLGGLLLETGLELLNVLQECFEELPLAGVFFVDDLQPLSEENPYLFALLDEGYQGSELRVVLPSTPTEGIAGSFDPFLEITGQRCGVVFLQAWVKRGEVVQEGMAGRARKLGAS